MFCRGSGSGATSVHVLDVESNATTAVTVAPLFEPPMTYTRPSGPTAAAGASLGVGSGAAGAQLPSPASACAIRTGATKASEAATAARHRSSAQCRVMDTLTSLFPADDNPGQSSATSLNSASHSGTKALVMSVSGSRLGSRTKCGAFGSCWFSRGLVAASWARSAGRCCPVRMSLR